MVWDAQRYPREAAFARAHGQPVLDLLDPHPGERIFDLGCGAISGRTEPECKSGKESRTCACSLPAPPASLAGT
jgi:hypothetical protein